MVGGGGTAPPALKIDVQAVNTQAAQSSGHAADAPIHRAAGQGQGQGLLHRARAAGAGATGGGPQTPNGDAQTTEQTTADGEDTFGVVNRHPLDPAAAASAGGGFSVGVSVDRNKKCRRTMEDAHSFIYDFGGIRGQGYFAVFDGHAGKHAAEWCGHNFHLHLLDHLRKAPAHTPVPDLLNATFLVVDTKLSELAVKGGTHSGCTAVTCFLRLEDDDGNPAGDASGVCKEVVPVPPSEGEGAHVDVVTAVDKDTPLKVARQLGQEEEQAGRMDAGRRREKDPLDPFDGGRDTTADELRNLREEEEEAEAQAAASPPPAAAVEGEVSSSSPREGEDDSTSKDLKQRIKDMLGVSTTPTIPGGGGNASSSSTAAARRPGLGQRESGRPTGTGDSELELPSSAISTSSETPPTSSTTHSSKPSSASTAAARPEEGKGKGKIASLIPDSPSLPPSFSEPAISLPRERAPRRTLYTANVGDARAVLSRKGKAVRLTYDHKGSDAKEAKRIGDAGGYVLNNRVNGVLAVTRSLGDSSMKEFVVGSPYTTETRLGPYDDFLIVACDGLWDVCSDQEAVDLVADCADDAQAASQKLLDHALNNFSTDNLSVLVVSLHPPAKASQRREESTRDQGAGMIANP
ncbi:Protein phosphatase 2C 1 [Rhodotorula mucilaginosa]|uniref:Protein phosphatase 2C 1 n=1 Tax=Rhodotorula mucilaginosa TaxID=5537 RepID=A0A9P7B2U4_RHOMI|nr:Protein phosphatase 2C 1 [Rhodotorula mucilaginosa]